MKCPCCNGTGTVSILQNPSCHFDGWEDPLYVEEGCEECGGTGESPDEGLWCAQCGSADLSQESKNIRCKNCGFVEEDMEIPE